MKNNVSFFLSYQLTHFPLLSSPVLSTPIPSSPPPVVLPYASCSPSFSHFLFLLTKNEGKSANPVLAELELCVQAEYIEFFPLPLFPFFNVTFCSMRFGEGDFYP